MQLLRYIYVDSYSKSLLSSNSDKLQTYVCWKKIELHYWIKLMKNKINPFSQCWVPYIYWSIGPTNNKQIDEITFQLSQYTLYLKSWKIEKWCCHKATAENWKVSAVLHSVWPNIKINFGCSVPTHRTLFEQSQSKIMRHVLQSHLSSFAIWLTHKRSNYLHRSKFPPMRYTTKDFSKNAKLQKTTFQLPNLIWCHMLLCLMQSIFSNFLFATNKLQ